MGVDGIDIFEYYGTVPPPTCINFTLYLKEKKEDLAYHVVKPHIMLTYLSHAFFNFVCYQVASGWEGLQ